MMNIVTINDSWIDANGVDGEDNENEDDGGDDNE